MKSSVGGARIGLLVAVACLASWPIAAQEGKTKDPVKEAEAARARAAAESAIAENCSNERRRYREAEESLAGRKRRKSELIGEGEKDLALARSAYCRCLEQAKLQASSDYQKLCVEKGSTFSAPPVPPMPPAPATGAPEASAECLETKRIYEEAVQRVESFREGMKKFPDYYNPEELTRLDEIRLHTLGRYCDCVREAYAKAGLPLPEWYYQVCAGLVSPPPGGAVAAGGAAGADPCSVEMKAYSRLRARLESLPEDQRYQARPAAREAFQRLCDCLRRTSPPKWEALCKEGADAMLQEPGAGKALTRPWVVPGAPDPSSPPPPPAPPPAPGGAIGGSAPDPS